MKIIKRLYLPSLVMVFSIFFISGCSEPLPSQNFSSGNSQVSVDKSEEPEESEETMALYKKITAKEAYEMMNQGEVIVLDVRTLNEYNQGHIENSVLLPVDEIKLKASTVLPDKGATILVYCRSGNRSFYASKDLLELGYTEVFDFGGIIDWPYEITK